MTYRVEVSAATINELSGKLAALASQLKGLPSTFDVLRVEAAEVQAPEPAPVETKATTPDPAPETEPAQPARVYDYNTDVAPRVLELVSKAGRPVAEKVLSSFGVKRASELDPSRFGQLLDAVAAAMEG
jgi:hypothetical protein